jgi:hypothetical protein
VGIVWEGGGGIKGLGEPRPQVAEGVSGRRNPKVYVEDLGELA